jgi:hypothetical protein
VFGEDHVDTLSSMLNLSASFARDKEFKKALEYGQRALRHLQVKPGPDHPTTLLCMGNVAAYLIDSGDPAHADEAVPVIDECLRRAAGKPVAQQLAPELLIRRLRVFQKKQDAVECRKTAERWEAASGRTRPDTLVLSARMRAVTAGVGGPTSAEDADRAMIWLTQAVAAGYRDVKHLKNEPDFAPLQGRDDFKKLLVELVKPTK